jgi:DNA polymerase-1
MLTIFDKELSQDSSLTWWLTNMTFDFCMLTNSGVRAPTGPAYCTLAMDWLHDENRSGFHGLKDTALHYCGLNMISFKDTFEKEHKEDTVEQRLLRGLKNDFRGAINYASFDAYATYRVKDVLRDKLADEEMVNSQSLWDYYREIELPFTRVLFNLIRRGIMVDTGYLEDLKPKLADTAMRLERQINKIAGKEINLKSTKQLRWLLFEKMGLKPIKKTETQEPSTDESVLSFYAEEGIEICELITKLRKVNKINGTYVEGLSKWADHDGRIHPTLTQHVTVTGRLSSVDPNLQNVPKPDHDDYHLREAFIPRHGYVFVVFDYSQLEMRLLAHEAHDQNMIDVINRGWDIHAGTACIMYNYDYDELNKALKKKKNPQLELSALERAMCDARSAAKAIGFGLSYGEGPKKLAKKLGISYDEALVKIEDYFRPYPDIRQFINDTHRLIRTDQMVRTVSGRPRRFPAMHTLGGMSKWHMSGAQRGELARAERQSVNSRIQGSAADVARRAMIHCEYDSRLANLGVQMLLQIHDELIFEVPEESVKEATPIIKNIMEHPLPYDLSVPLECDGGSGYSWASAKG